MTLSNFNSSPETHSPEASPGPVLAGSEPLVLLHGWGSDGRSWQPLLQYFGASIEVRVVDLPGFGKAPASADIDRFLEQLLEDLPPRFALLGWSLGGMLATQLAARYPQRVTALVTLATNACFVARADWPEAMDPPTFERFSAGLAADEGQTLQRFAGLMAKGDARARQLLKPLRQCAQSSREATAESWQQALNWLQALDNRSALAAMTVPALHLFGAADALVPVAAARAVRALNRDQLVEVVPATGHALHWSAPATIGARIGRFLQAAERAVAKRKIARSFGKAAATYDSVAELQRQVGHSLLARVAPPRAELCLDLGCGTGYFMPQLAPRFGQVLGLDLAEGMLRYAREKRGDFTWVCGDAEYLPLAEGAVDCIFSAMALQWCADLPALFQELGRVVAADGRVYIATLGPGTLAELRAAWSEVDQYTHVNQFAGEAAIRAALAGSGLALRNWHTETIVMHYKDVRELTYELKTLGAHNMNRGQSGGLTGRQRILAFKRAYEKFRDARQRLPASWEVYYLELARQEGDHG
ncbi:malonyl-ACP O-methyltransferase BioC [Pseudomaricurvus alcaniphilus]|uniref:malonyl-ACP O-methyltransferase BioC n=1 Tax=Pseudomaricurvus alcaniphilus TaxID=1166482 RepID=UPI003132BC0A